MNKIIIIIGIVIIGAGMAAGLANAFLISDTYLTDRIIPERYTHDKIAACENLIDDAITINPYPGCTAEIIVLTTDDCADNYHTKMYDAVRKIKFTAPNKIPTS